MGAGGIRGGSGSGYGRERRGTCGLLEEGKSWKGKKGMRKGGVFEMEEEFFKGPGAKGGERQIEISLFA